MYKIVGRVIVIVGFLVATLVGVKRAQAVGCMVIENPYYCCIDGECGDLCFNWTTGDCGGIDNGGCPPNTHWTPNGGCRENGDGDECPCDTKPDGSCKSCGGGAPGCPTPNDCEVKATLAGSTRSYIVTGLQPETTYYFRLLHPEIWV